MWSSRAKLAAAGLAGIAFAVICVGVTFGAGIAVLAARDVDSRRRERITLLLCFGPIAAACSVPWWALQSAR